MQLKDGPLMRMSKKPGVVTRTFFLRLAFVGWCLLVTMQIAGLTQASLPTANGEHIEVLSATQLSGSSVVRFEVKIDYEFPGRETVWLQGIGTLPSSGQLSYVVQGREIVFRAARSGKVIGSRGITTYAQMPEDGDPFPSTLQFGPPDLPNVTLSLPLPQAKASVLSKLADSKNPKRLTLKGCRPDDEGCALSPWTTITDPTEHIQAQVSVMLVYQTDSTNKKSTVFKIFYVGRQAYRGGSEWSTSLNDSIRTLIQNWIAQLRNTILEDAPKQGGF
jgi:hypothetical protein